MGGVGLKVRFYSVISQAGLLVLLNFLWESPSYHHISQSSISCVGRLIYCYIDLS